MLSNDELTDGMTFVMKLRDAAGKPIFWMKKLRGDVARHWYDIYRRSNWEALRAEAADVFGLSVSSDDAEHAIKAMRCVVIQALSVSSTELAAGHGMH